MQLARSSEPHGLHRLICCRKGCEEVGSGDEGEPHGRRAAEAGERGRDQSPPANASASLRSRDGSEDDESASSDEDCDVEK